MLDARRGYVAGAQSYDVYDRHASEMEAEDVRHVAAHDPRAVLADVEAKRAIAALHTQAEIYGQVFDECVTCVDWNAQGDYESPPPHRWPCPTLRLLASCYRHHPGWRAEWAPETDDA